MKALVIGTDYFADRFKYLLDKEGIYVRGAAKLPRDLEYDMVFFSGASCTPDNIRRALKNGVDVFSEQIIFDGAEDVSVVEYAREQGSKLYIGSFNIFNPVVRQMAKLIEGRDVPFEHRHSGGFPASWNRDATLSYRFQRPVNRYHGLLL
jgi:hypothetical protein